jgi:hypothetical protein
MTVTSGEVWTGTLTARHHSPPYRRSKARSTKLDKRQSVELVLEAPAIATSVRYWARAIEAARSGNSSQARMNAEHIKLIHDGMIAAKQNILKMACWIAIEYLQLGPIMRMALIRDKAFGTLRALLKTKKPREMKHQAFLPAKCWLICCSMQSSRTTP